MIKIFRYTEYTRVCVYVYGCTVHVYVVSPPPQPPSSDTDCDPIFGAHTQANINLKFGSSSVREGGSE